MRRYEAYNQRIMSELWTPRPENHYPDPTNIYDMMMVFQEQLDQGETVQSKIETARFAIVSLRSNLEEMAGEARQVTLATEVAIFSSNKDAGTGTLAENVGMNGLLDNIHCIRAEDQNLPFALSLGIDAVNVFPIDEPEKADCIVSNAKAPISRIRSIEICSLKP